jgi:hypothetical protein
MRKNILIIIGILLVIGFEGCDEKIGALERINLAPTVSMYTLNEESWFLPEKILADTGKISNPESGFVYSIGLRLNDRNKNYEEISLATNSGGSFFVNGSRVVGSTIIVKVDSLNLAYSSSTTGNHQFNLTAIDDFGKKNNLVVDVHLKENLVPIADFQITHRNILSVNEYSLDARKSFDQDEKFGGKIQLYEFHINQIKILSSEPIVNHVFSKGKHTIKLRVRDNDFQWSETVEKLLLIN